VLQEKKRILELVHNDVGYGVVIDVKNGQYGHHYQWLYGIVIETSPCIIKILLCSHCLLPKTITLLISCVSLITCIHINVCISETKSESPDLVQEY
jgi:hypothetical protein